MLTTRPLSESRLTKIYLSLALLNPPTLLNSDHKVQFLSVNQPISLTPILEYPM